MLRALVLASLLVAVGARAQDVTLAPDALHVPLPDLARRDASLRTYLAEAAQREKHRGWVLPLLLVVGSGFVAVGAALPTEVGGVALPLGAQTLLRGTLALAGTDDARKLPARYAAVARLSERVQLGEWQLARLARQHRRNRLIDGIATIALAACTVPLRYGFARLDSPGYRIGDSYVDYLFLTFAALGATDGVLTLFEQTPAEAAWARYTQPPEPTRGHPLLRVRNVVQARFAF